MVVVRPDAIDEDDENWAASIEEWRNEARAIAGNPIQILEVSRAGHMHGWPVTTKSGATSTATASSSTD